MAPCRVQGVLALEIEASPGKTEGPAHADLHFT
jgi:hypothetical protein